MHHRFIPCPALESNPEMLYADKDEKLFCFFAVAFKMALFPRKTLRTAHPAGDADLRTNWNLQHAKR